MLDVLDEDFWSSVNEEALLVHPVTWTDLEHDYHDVIDLLDNLTVSELNSTLWSNWSSADEASSSNHYSTWQIALLATLAGITSLATIAGNLVVILSFIVERTIRQPTNYFIASLAVSDLLIGSVSMPFYTVYLLAGQRWPLGEMLCDLWLSIDYTVCLCSIYTVFCITIDRFCSVKIPARYRDWRTENKVLAMVAVTWAMPVFVFFTSIFGWQYFVGERTVPEGKCYVQYMEAALFNCLLQIGYFWITLVIMCALYTGIYQVVLNLSRKSDQKKKKLTTMVNMVGSALKMRTTTEEDEQNRLRIPNRNEEDDSGASDDLEMTQKQRNRKRLSSNTGSESDPSQSPGRSPVPTRRKPTQGRRKGSDICQPSNGQGGNHASSRTGRALFFGKRKNGGMKTSGGNRDTLRQAIVVSEVKEGSRPADICLVLPDSDISEQCNDPPSSQDIVAQTEKTGVGKAGQSNIGTSIAKAPSAITLQVPGQSTHPHHREEFTQQRSHSSTNLDLLTVRPEVSRKSSSISISSRRCSRSNSTIGPVNFRRWSATKTQPKPRNANSSENRARKALRTITVILGAFVLCWTPWHVLSMIISFCPEEKICVEPLLYDISYWLCYLNSPINPLCYALANQQFKKTFIRIIKLDFHRT